MLRKIKNSQIVFVSLALCFLAFAITSCERDSERSCDQDVPSQTQRHNEPESSINQDVPSQILRYNESGHSYTVFALAKMAQWGDWSAYNLAIGSQLPDVLDGYTALNTKNISINNNYLHSFHGGDSEAIAYRRNVLGALIKDSIETIRVDYVQIGMYAHAFGDAFAHTYVADDGREEAYGALLGHVFDGIRPDMIALNKEKYLLYTSRLFTILGGNIESMDYLAFESYVNFMDEYNPQDAALAFKNEMIAQYGFNPEIYSTMMNQAAVCTNDAYMQNVILEIEKVVKE